MEPKYRTPRLHELDVESSYCWWLRKIPCTHLGSIKPNLVDNGISTNLTWCGSSSINSREVFRMNLKNIFEAKTHPPPRLRLFWFILATRGWCFGGQWWNGVDGDPISSSRGDGWHRAFFGTSLCPGGTQQISLINGPPWCIRVSSTAADTNKICWDDSRSTLITTGWPHFGYRKHNLSGDRFLLCEGLSVHILVPFHRLALRTVQLICNLGHLRLPTNYPTFSVLMYRF